MAYTAGFSVNVGDPTKASDVTTLAANDDYLKTAVDKIMADAATPSFALRDGVTATTQSSGNNSTKLATTAYADAATLSFANDANDRVVTGTGSGLNGEANLTFDGSTLGVSGVIAGTGDLTITQGTDTTTGSDPIAVFERTGDSQTGVSLKSNNVHGLILRADGTGFGAIHSKDDLAFYTGTIPGSTYGDVRMRIVAATGNVGIGTTAPGSYKNKSGAKVLTILNSDSGSSNNSAELSLSGAASNTQCTIGFYEATTMKAQILSNLNNDGELYFKTNGDNTRMLIDANGRVNIGETNAVSAGNGALGVYNNQNGQMTATIANTHTSGDPLILDLDFSGRAADNNTGWFLRCQDSSAARMYVYSDGDVWTSDAGTLTSDERLKNNIVDATDKLADVMKLKVRNFEWNTDYHPAKNGEKKLGFIAQELETVFPSLITEHDVARDNKIDEELYDADDDTQYYVDGDEIPDGKEVGDVKTESQIPDGKEIGDIKIAGKAHEPTMRKAYKNAFAPILVKALQEVTVRLEAAEAEIAALKSA